MRQNWHNVVQKTIFALLLLNTCLLAGVILPPFFGFPGFFSKGGLPLLAADLPAQQQAGGLFGNIRLATEENLSLPQARVLLNGQEAGNFGGGGLLLRVYEGDTLGIDASAYKTQLRFHISAVSSNIDAVTLPPLLSTDGDIIVLPPIRFK